MIKIRGLNKRYGQFDALKERVLDLERCSDFRDVTALLRPA